MQKPQKNNAWFSGCFKVGCPVCLQPISAVDVYPSRLAWNDLCVIQGHTYHQGQGMSNEQRPASVCQYMTQTHDIGSGRSMECTQTTVL